MKNPGISTALGIVAAAAVGGGGGVGGDSLAHCLVRSCYDDDQEERWPMSDEIIFAVEESPEGGYEAKALSAPIFTDADSLDELRTMVRDAVSCQFDEDERPKIIRLHFVRNELIAV